MANPRTIRTSLRRLVAKTMSRSNRSVYAAIVGTLIFSFIAIHLLYKLDGILMEYNVEEYVRLQAFDAASQTEAERVYHARPSDSNIYHLCVICYKNDDWEALHYYLTLIKRRHNSLLNDTTIKEMLSKSGYRDEASLQK